MAVDKEPRQRFCHLDTGMPVDIDRLIDAQNWFEAKYQARRRLLTDNDPLWFCKLTEALEKVGELSEAKDCLEQLITVFPEKVPFLTEYGRVLALEGSLAAAAAVWQQVLKIAPHSLPALFNLARARVEMGDLADAVLFYEKLLNIKPDHEDALFNLANLRHKQDEYEIAETIYQKLLSRNHNHLDAWINLGQACKCMGDYVKAEFCCRQVIRLDEENVTAHWNLSHILLGQARWREGWCEYEWRLRRSAAFVPPGLENTPLWQGELLDERRLLLWVEQGAGDAIQFARFISRLPGRHLEVILYCPSGLVRLFTTLSGVHRVISYELPPPAGIDYHLSLLSLPHRLSLSSMSALSCGPYLKPPAKSGQNKIIGNGKFKVGLVWAGNPHHDNDARRSVPFSYFSELLNISGVAFFSLQVFVADNGYGLLNRLPPEVTDLAPQITDFADTAGFLSQLDLLITVDTAAAHLAGALGVEAWVLLPRNADWRWLRDRHDTPWYPGLKLFRQHPAGVWPPVIEEVRRELCKRLDIGGLRADFQQ